MPARQDFDVLFYGAMNERRAKVLQALKAVGLNVVTLFGSYGRERDEFIARAKRVVNVHYYPTNIFEIVRCSYLFANGKAVVSELAPDTEIYPEVRECVVGVAYDNVAAECACLLGDESRLKRQGARAREIYSEFRLDAFPRAWIADA